MNTTNKTFNYSKFSIRQLLNGTYPFFRFILVGILNTFIGLSTIFILMNYLNQSYWTATFIGNGIGAINSFFLNRSFTFNSKISIWRGAIKFFFMYFICYYFSFSLAEWLVSDLIFYDKEIAVVMGTVFYIITNYLGQKLFVFRKTR